MASIFNENQRFVNAQGEPVSITHLTEMKKIGFYFSAHWCACVQLCCAYLYAGYWLWIRDREGAMPCAQCLFGMGVGVCAVLVMGSVAHEFPTVVGYTYPANPQHCPCVYCCPVLQC